MGMTGANSSSVYPLTSDKFFIIVSKICWVPFVTSQRWSIPGVIHISAIPVVYYGKVLSGGKGIANVPVTDGTQIVLTDDKGRYSISSTSNAEYIYITLPDGYNIPMKGKVPAFFQKVPEKTALIKGDTLYEKSRG